MPSSSRYDDDSILLISFDLFHRTDYIVHEFKADGIRAVGTIQRQVADSVLAIENYRFVFHTALHHRLHRERIAAVNRNCLSRDPARRVGTQKQNHVGCVFRLANPLNLVNLQHPLDCFRIRCGALDSRRARRAQCDTVGGDSRAAKIFRDRPHEARGARLGARVDLQMRLADPPCIRDHSHDLAVLVGNHSWSGDSYAVQHAEKIGAEEGLPILRLLLPEGFARDGARIGAGVAGVVHQDIDFTESHSRFFEHRGDRRKIGHIALRRDRFDPKLFNFGGYRLGALETEIVYDYAAGIVLGEAERDCASDALSCTSHQPDAALEIENLIAHVLLLKIFLDEYTGLT